MALTFTHASRLRLIYLVLRNSSNSQFQSTHTKGVSTDAEDEITSSAMIHGHHAP